MELDKTDLAILRALEKNSRASYREIASEVDVAVGTVQSRIKKLEEAGVLRGFQPVVDYSKLGYGITTFIGIRSKIRDTTPLEKRYSEHRNVMDVWRVTGDVDLILHTKFKTAAELDNFLKRELSDKDVSLTVTYVALSHTRKKTSLLEGR
jgi:DNA-binding Lrp family transcriptional regulator